MPVDPAELAGEPAGAALRDLLARVRAADPGVLAELADQVRTIGGGTDDTARALARDVAAGERWQGPGADACAAWLAAFGRAGARTRGLAERTADELTRAARALHDVRDEVDRQAEQGMAAARTARARAAVTGDAQTSADRAAAATMAAPTAAAQAAVARAEAELARVAGVVGGLVGGFRVFAALPEPDSAPVGAPAGPATGVADGQPVEPRPSPGSGELVEAPDASAPPASRTGSVPAGRVGDWIREAVGILAAAGVPTDRMDPGDIATIIDRESGGDPLAVNGSDANAARGTPSQGLMQTIGPTFRSYRLPGHGDIHDPIDNIIAGVRYAIARYGSVSRVPGVVALAQGRSYVGY